MPTKWEVSETEGDSSLPVEEGGEIVFDRRIKRGGTIFRIQPADQDSNLVISVNGESDNRNQEKGQDQELNSIRNDKLLLRIVAAGITISCVAVVLTVCTCVLVAVSNDAYRNTLTTRDLIPIVSVFLQTTVNVLFGALLVGMQRKNGG